MFIFLHYPRLSAPTNEANKWELKAEINFKRKSRNGNISSPPQVGITPLIIVSTQSANQTTYKIAGKPL